MENHQATVEGIALRPRKLSKGQARTSCSSWAPSTSHAVAPGTAGGCEPRRPTHTRSPLRPWVSIRRCRQLRRLGKQRFCISDRECPTENTISDWRPVESMQREVLTVESKVMCGFLTPLGNSTPNLYVVQGSTVVGIPAGTGASAAPVNIYKTQRRKAWLSLSVCQQRGVCGWEYGSSGSRGLKCQAEVYLSIQGP